MPGIDGPYTTSTTGDFVFPALRDVVSVLWDFTTLPEFVNISPDIPTNVVYRAGWLSLGLDLTFAGLFPAFVEPHWLSKQQGAWKPFTRVGDQWDRVRATCRPGGSLSVWVLYA